MSIDWFTFVAQIVNFLILVVLLRWLLYGPIVRAMTRREEAIAARLREAEQARHDGEELVRQYQSKHRELDARREAMLTDARREVDEQKQDLTVAARDEVQRRRLEWYQGLRREQRHLLAEMQRGAGQLSLEATRRALVELADESLEDRMLSLFLAHLPELDGARRAQIADLLRDGKTRVVLRSAFDLSDAWRNRLIAALREVLAYEGPLEFETSPDLICGAELELGGYRFGWNVNEFMRHLETDFDQRLKEAEARP